MVGTRHILTYGLLYHRRRGSGCGGYTSYPDLWSTVSLVYCIVGGGGEGVVGTRHILTYGLLYHWSTVS